MKKTLFNNGWYFSEFELNTPFENMNSSDILSPVELPHDWMIWHVKDLYKDSIGFYKKKFTAALTPGHSYFLRFEGVYMDCEVFLNKTKAFEWKYGYSTFDVDLTPYIKEGSNEVAVACNYKSPNTRWYSGAGIYRNVYFYEKEESYIVPDGVYLSSKPCEEGYTLSIDTELFSGKEEKSVLKHFIFDKERNLCSSYEKELFLSAEITVDKQTVIISAPHLWDINDPYLYRVKTELWIDGRLVDTEENPLGFRTISFDCNKGFFLNGRHVKINGACQHHDLGALGAAVNKTAIKRQLLKLREMGVNSVRTSHNMPSVELMELADEMGFLINSEAFDMWELPKTTYDYGNFFPTWYTKDVRSWIRRDRNHPSVIIWSIGNEIYDTHSEKGLEWTKLLRDNVKLHDYNHNAYIGIGSNYIEWEGAQKCSNELELSGYNYGERLYDEHHKKYPHWCIFGSETGSTVQSRGIYHFPYENRLLTYEDGQCSSLGNCTTNWGAKSVGFVVSNHRDCDYVFGQYIWTGWDYIGEPTPYFSKNSFFGQIDTAGFEKDTFYHYQAEWTDVKENPMVHLLPYWDFNEGRIIDVCAYSNAPYVELFFNGTSLGKQYIDHNAEGELQGHWKLPYAKGELKVLAYDEEGNVIASDSQKSFSDPEKVVLSFDKKELTADGKDLIFATISTVDKEGTFVANARNRMKVSVSGAGRLVGLDNGDSTDYEEYKGTSRKLFSGKLLAIIQATDQIGEIKVSVESAGLTGATDILSAVAMTDFDKEEKEAAVIEPFMSCIPSETLDDIPVRKIGLKCLGPVTLNADQTSTDVELTVFPASATFSDISVSALTKDAVEANFVKVSLENKIAHIEALGDGHFILTAFANNGKEHAEIISELEFDITGLGCATFNPYEMVPGIQYAAGSGDFKISFKGGVFLSGNSEKETYVTYSNIDFGSFGSDEITLPIFSFNDEINLEIWEGTYDSHECLYSGTYRAKSIYNTYQPNTFKLSRRISGTKSITIVFHINDRISLQGFEFKKIEKTYSTILAGEATRITGDSFKITGTDVTEIGNNVTLEYEDMDFSEKGLSAIEITGCSHNPVTSLHLLFFEGEASERQMIEIPFSETYETFTIPLTDVRIKGKMSIVFLPGTNFDLRSFRFVK